MKQFPSGVADSHHGPSCKVAAESYQVGVYLRANPENKGRMTRRVVGISRKYFTEAVQAKGLR